MIKPRLFYKFSKAGRALQKDALSLRFFNRFACFETMRAYEGEIFRVETHMRRLYESQHGLAKRLPWTQRHVISWVESSLRSAGLKNAMLRLMAVFGERDEAALILFVRYFGGHPEVYYKKGIRVGFAAVKKDSLRSSFPQVKSNQYTASVHALLDDADKGFNEHIFLGNQGSVTEGTISNIALLKKHELFTAAPRCGILKGVTQDAVADACRGLGIQITEKVLSRHDLYSADEAFLMTTLSELMPITHCDHRVIGTGRPGRLTRRIHKEFRTLVFKRG